MTTRGACPAILSLDTNHITRKYYITDYLTVTKVGNGATVKRHFIQKDRLGSTTQVVDDNGSVVKQLGYDAFGKPRNGDWTDMANFAVHIDIDDPASHHDLTRRGFTGHEHVDELQLIHMNGRMYDFNNGRFLSVDPFIQGDSSQAINPYSYIQNNPLSGVDPTGYKSICGEEGKRKCDAIIGSHHGSQVWNGYANTNGKVVAVVVVIGEDGDTSDIYSINDRDQITKVGSDFLKGRSLKFASHTQRLMYMLAFENGAAFGLLNNLNAEISNNDSSSEEGFYTGSGTILSKDPNNHGEFIELLNGKVKVAKWGSKDAVVSEVEISLIESSLIHISNDEGLRLGDGSQFVGGKQMLGKLSSIKPLVILLNTNGEHAALNNKRRMTIDIGFNVYIKDYSNNKTWIRTSLIRKIVHEAGHAILGYRDPQNVLFTDSIMKRINKTSRVRYNNWSTWCWWSCSQ